MTRVIRLALCAALAAGPAGAAPHLVPPNPFIDKGACPFECCTYRDWKTTKPITLLDRPDGKIHVATVPAGVTVRGVTGEVHSTPLRLVSRYAEDGSPIRKGSVIYLLHYAGEGDWAAWYRNKVYTVGRDPFFVSADVAKSLHAAWWVNIRAPDGKTGWVLDKDQFDDQDACG